MGITLVQTAQRPLTLDGQPVGSVLSHVSTLAEHNGQHVVTVFADGDGTSCLELVTMAPTVRTGVGQLADYLERVARALRAAIPTLLVVLAFVGCIEEDHTVYKWTGIPEEHACNIAGQWPSKARTSTYDYRMVTCVAGGTLYTCVVNYETNLVACASSGISRVPTAEAP